MTEFKPEDIVAEPEDRPDPDALAGEEIDLDAEPDADPWAEEAKE